MAPSAVAAPPSFCRSGRRAPHRPVARVVLSPSSSLAKIACLLAAGGGCAAAETFRGERRPRLGVPANPHHPSIRAVVCEQPAETT